MSKILVNQISNYGDNSPIEVKEGLNIPAGKPLQVEGVSGSSGQVLTSTGTSVQWTTPFDGDYNSLINKPTIPAAQVSADWTATSGVARILNKPIVPPLPSVTTAPASGSGSLSYTSFDGEFTFTPPDLSPYLTSLGDAAGVTSAKITNWDTAYGWGDHAQAGYLTAYTESQTLDDVLTLGATTTQDITTTGKVYFSNNFAATGDLPDASTYHGMFAHVHDEGHGYFAHAGGWTQLLDTGSSLGDLANVDLDTTAPTTGQVLTYDGANWIPGTASGGGGGVSLTDFSVTTNAAGTAALSYNNLNGTFTYTPPDLSGYLTSYTETDPVFTASDAAAVTAAKITNWDTAHGWGDHANGGYLVATAQDKTNWDTAYGWGDHANAGYLTSLGDAANVTAAKITNWDTAHSWGDHGTEGYLTTVALNDVSDVTITTPSNGEVLTYNGSGWVNSAPTGGGGANVTISDIAPTSPDAGDLWWESDTGRLKIRYHDVDSQQWVDASPPLADATSIGGSGTVAMKASIIPDTNAAYDIGSAEYKIRDLYLDSGSIHTPSEKNLSFYDGNLTWGGDDVIMLQDLKDMMATATSFEDFKNAIMGL